MSSPSLADEFFVAAMSPEFRDDPYPFYERYRAADPLLRLGDAMWFCLSHAEVTALLRDPRLSSDEQHKSGRRIGEAAVARQPLVFMDPPDHTRLRGLVARAFTPRRIAEMRAQVEALSAALLDGVSTPTVDLVVAYARPLPIAVICSLLGVPAEDEAVFGAWSADLTRMVDPSVLRTPDDDARIEAAESALRAYFDELLARRRREPHDDLLSALVAVEADGDRVTTDEAIDLAVLLLVAGHETTVNLIGNGVLALLRHPEELTLLRARPDLVENAVDEFLRFDAPVQMSQRIATEDLQLAGHDVRAGDEIIAVLGAANRDPAAFDDPGRLDVARPARHHVSFGGGIHHCLGAALARMEATVAFRDLLARFERIELAGEVVRRDSFTLRGPTSLPLALA